MHFSLLIILSWVYPHMSLSHPTDPVMVNPTTAADPQEGQAFMLAFSARGDTVRWTPATPGLVQVFQCRVQNSLAQRTAQATKRVTVSGELNLLLPDEDALSVRCVSVRCVCVHMCVCVCTVRAILCTCVSMRGYSVFSVHLPPIS